MTAPQHTSVAIVGGGPAGASAARELARRGIATSLLERSAGGGSPVGECLAPSVNPLLHRLGLSEALLASGPLPSHGNRSAWGGDGEIAEHDFLREPFGPGWHLDRPGFNTALLQAAADAGATLWQQAHVNSLQRADGEWHLVVAMPGSTRTMTAAYLIDASGRAAAVARRQGVRPRRFDALVAAVAILRPRRSGLRDATTVVEAAEDGWWYSALLPGGELAVAWFTDPDLLARTVAWRPPGWWALLALSAATRERVAAHGGEQPETIRVMAAGSSLLPRPAGDGWLAAGDAAAAYDPLSSHGIGSALAGGQRAASAIAAALDGDETAFSTYTDCLFANYAHYLWLRHAYYTEERRWPDAPFWARRQSGLSTPGSDGLSDAGRYASYGSAKPNQQLRRGLIHDG